MAYWHTESFLEKLKYIIDSKRYCFLERVDDNLVIQDKSETKGRRKVPWCGVS